jgi:putative restriction endonuclease
LSIKTVFPRKGGRLWYDDQREVHQQIYAGDDVVDYAFMGTDPSSADNRWLLDAMREQTPVIYFLGTSPGRYQPIILTFAWGGTRSDYGFSLPSGRSWGPPLKQCHQTCPSVAMRFARSRRGYTKRPSEMPS